MFTLHVDNLRALREVRWAPRGTCALVGPNGSGKTTLLLTLKLLRHAYDRGLQDALIAVLGGPAGLRNRTAAEDDPIRLGVETDGLRWTIEMMPRGPRTESQTIERLFRGDELLFERYGGGSFSFRGATFSPDSRLGVRAIADAPEPPPEVERVGALLQSLHVYHDPDLMRLRTNGSQRDANRHLHSQGINAFAMLHKWASQRPNRARFDFVVQGLRGAFPGIFHELDFEIAGTSLFINTYAPGSETPTSSSNEANGLLAMLVLLCDVAAAPEGGVVAIDEPETALHPFAIRELHRRASRWAQQRDLTLVYSTHSPVLLDQLTGDPASVFVMRPSDAVAPVRLDRMKNPEWLRQFTLGELLASGELASNDDVRVSKTG